MIKKIHPILAALLLLLILIPLTISATSQEEEQTEEWIITDWLLLGPFPNPLPALLEEYKKEQLIENLIKFHQVDKSKLIPISGSPLRWHDGTLSRWRKIQSGENGVSLIGDKTHPTIAYFGTYLDVKRWTRARVTIQSPQAFHLCVDGRIYATKSNASRNGNNSSTANRKKVSTDLSLETGKHLLIVKSVYDPSSDEEWTLKGTITIDENYTAPHPTLILSNEHNMRLYHLLDVPTVTGISISPDGTLVAVSVRKALPPSDDSETWVELYDVSESRLLQTYRGGTSLSRVSWAPTGKKFSYTTHNKSGATLWMVDLENGTSTPLLKDIKDFGSHTWVPDGTCIIYSVSEKGEKDRPGVKRLRNLADQKPWARNKSYLYKISLEDRVRQRLTAGEFSTSLNSISPDGKKLLYTRSLVDETQRPFLKTELYYLDLRFLENELLWEGRWFNQAQWSPDGSKILILGGPSTFADAGKNLSGNLIPNEYDIQAYMFDPQAKQVEPISKEFDPSIQEAFWSHTENAIYFLTTDHSYRRLYRYDIAKKKYLFIPGGVDIIEQFDLSKDKQVAAFSGSSASVPPKAYILNMKNKKTHLLHDPAEKEFSDVTFGKVERWTFKNQKGRLIDGRVYYPPDFDPKKKYPCIVNYYGGTTPVTREFGGRYPKNLWAAQGYVVYVLQPSGAIGYGQDFSSLHVNDWGFIVANEIIDGVKKFLSEHPFVDSKRLGCIGASYGGFITMIIQTRTNLFSAAASHAGISSISSYWGEGYYGYEYSAYAAANSFPWNRKDIFINQSALFSADKITTPLLLLHGSEDTNVPPGESTQLFTALKILGREVEYVQILDQDHHIMTYNKRKIWTRTIMAWFDRWLKDQSEWWYYLYPNN
ncbi:MAG: S9 family peptidase [Candidatus Aminicenantaceae bacterium]